MKKELWLVIGVVAIVLAVVVNTGDIGLGPRGGQVDGDVNGDGRLNVNDLLDYISYLFDRRSILPTSTTKSSFKSNHDTLSQIRTSREQIS